MFVVIIIIVVGIFAASFYNSYKISKTIETQGKEISESLNQINQLLPSFQKFPDDVAEIKSKISDVESRVNAITVESDKLVGVEGDLRQDLETIKQINVELAEIKSALEKMQEVYPPVQQQNLVFQNVSNDYVAESISTAINQRSKSFGIYFSFGALFGSLFGGSLIGVSLYFIFIKRRDKS